MLRFYDGFVYSTLICFVYTKKKYVTVYIIYTHACIYVLFIVAHASTAIVVVVKHRRVQRPQN